MLALFSALLQVNEDLKTIGALAGLLAVPGLAVLSLLYFGQAREVRRLRDWAGRAPERAAELEQRVTSQAQQRAQAAVTAPSTPAAQAATGTQPKPAAAPGGNGVAKPAPGAPATAAAQAATAGTAAAGAAAAAGAEKKDGDKAEADGKKEDEKKPDEAAAAGEKKDEDKKAEGEEKPDEAAEKKEEAKEPVAAAAGPPTVASPAATPAGAAAGAGAAAAATAAARSRGDSPPIPPRPAQPARASAPSATIPPRGGAPRRPGGGGFTEPPRSSRVSRAGLIGIGAAVLVLAITVAIVLKVTGGSDNSAAPTPNTVAGGSAAQQDAGGQTTAPAVSKAQRAQTNVAVLNGTTITGLARSVASRLQDSGYTVGNVTDAPNQAQPQTKVEYGSGHRDEATALATAIKVPPSRIVALSPVDSTTAGPNAEVVVVVGQDSAR